MEKKAFSLLHLLTGNILSPIKMAFFPPRELHWGFPCNYWTECFTEVTSVMGAGCFLGTSLFKACWENTLTLSISEPHFSETFLVSWWRDAMLIGIACCGLWYFHRSHQHFFNIYDCFVGHHCLITVAIAEKSHCCKQRNSSPVHFEISRRT